jgi:hypothetical protein
MYVPILHYESRVISSTPNNEMQLTIGGLSALRALLHQCAACS